MLIRLDVVSWIPRAQLDNLIIWHFLRIDLLSVRFGLNVAYVEIFVHMVQISPVTEQV